MKPSLIIIIVNWNSSYQLSKCLESIDTNTIEFELKRVIVVDNASQDGSADNLEKLNIPLTIIRNKENRGFAAACNQGALKNNADYLLFLNPDTYLFKDSLNKPISFMEKIENKNIGICGIQLINEENQIHRSCAYFPTFTWYIIKIFGLNYLLPYFLLKHLPKHSMFDWEHTDNRKVDQIIGAFFLIRCKLFYSLKGFDERFFVYFEEVDLSLRAAEAGWSSFYLSEAQAFHKGGGTSEQVKAHRLFYSLQSRIKYGYKHFNWFHANLLTILTLTVEPVSRIILALIKLSFKEVDEIVSGYIMLFQNYFLFTNKNDKNYS